MKSWLNLRELEQFSGATIIMLGDLRRLNWRAPLRISIACASYVAFL